MPQNLNFKVLKKEMTNYLAIQGYSDDVDEYEDIGKIREFLTNLTTTSIITQ